ncbi:MAG: hypothetical protein NT013_08115 [Planctomycetia bacterium]|nr:hypothetical protein [Planctomycetia bacterium]
MKAIYASALAALLVVVAGVWAADESATVTVRSVHLCCGACVEGAKGALDGIDGVSEPKADVNSKSVVFSAKNEKAAQKGIDALAEHGFYGKAAFGKKDLAFPNHGVKKGEKRDSVTFTGVHLCCGACKTAAKEAMTKLDGMTTLEIDSATGSIKLSGAGMVVQDAIDLLQKAGFYGKIEKPTKK